MQTIYKLEQGNILSRIVYVLGNNNFFQPSISQRVVNLAHFIKRIVKVNV